MTDSGAAISVAASSMAVDELAQARRGKALRLLPRIFAVLLVVLALGGVGAGVMLVAAVNKILAKQHELAANAAISLSAVTDLQADESALAISAAQSCSTAQTLTRWVGGLRPEQRERMPDSQQLLNSLQSLCAFGGPRAQQLSAFYAAYAPAVIARQKAAYDNAAGKYRIAAQAAGEDPDLQARALEGLAYSQLKQHDLDAAERTIARAAGLKADYVFTQITQMKIACARKSPSDHVAALFEAALAERRAIIQANAKDAVRERIASDDLALLLGDAELRSMCDYVKVPKA
jgi:hypothetical protein